MLAHTFKPAKCRIAGWFMSVKLDGMRAFWDGGITRGARKNKIKWANHKKDSRYLIPPTCTGLWSRYGNVIHAPDWFLDKLPKVMLDGELYIPGHRQDTMSIIKSLKPGPGWKDVKYHAFSMPSEIIFCDGRLSSPNFSATFSNVMPDLSSLDHVPHPMVTFRSEIALMHRYCPDFMHHQEQLPRVEADALARIEEALELVVADGGEGLILRKPESFWTPRREHTMLKVKKFDDDEGIVVGYTSGRQTDKGSKLLGLMGALILDYSGKRLELSGFTDAERLLAGEAAAEWCTNNPGQECPDWITSDTFPRGASVTFRFRGKTRDGIPQEARFWRLR